MPFQIQKNQAGQFVFYAHPSIEIGSRPLDTLPCTLAEDDFMAGEGDGYRWETHIMPAHGGYWLNTTLHVQHTVNLNPSMILWVSGLDNFDDRQAHTWRQTIVRAPTTNQQGLGGNDLPAGYLYDRSTQTETICYFPPDHFQWAPQRFYHFSIREVLSYQKPSKYGIGLVPNPPDVEFRFEPGTHKLAWWFIVRHRETIPTQWEAQQILIDTLAPLLDAQPRLMPDAVSWQAMAENLLKDLHHEACWITIGGQTGLRAYVRGSSAVKRDEAQGFELMTQLDVLWPLLLWQRSNATDAGHEIVQRLLKTLPHFHRPKWDYVTNNFPPHDGDSFMDTWYFLENALIKLAWVTYLTDDANLRAMFFTALKGAERFAHKTHYLFPLFADADGWQVRGSILNVGVAGLYAAGQVLAYQLDGQNPAHLDEAAQALHTMTQLSPGQLTHEPQQLTFGAGAAAYLARHGFPKFREIAKDLVYLSLRMGYWGSDPAVPFYDPRGMFQACASLSYPAYKENIETIMGWAELLKYGIGPAPLMSAFINLQRCHNYAFFDPYLPAQYRHEPCAYVPYEDIATSEFQHTAEMGKELYGAGEVFWSALLFKPLPDVPDVLCLCLDVPGLELSPLPAADERTYLLYNPSSEERCVQWVGQIITLAPYAIQVTQ